MVDGDSRGHNVFEICEIEVEPFVDTARAHAGSIVRIERLLAEPAVSCELGSHFESVSLLLSRTVTKNMMTDC